MQLLAQNLLAEGHLNNLAAKMRPMTVTKK
jgi:hypothetical protein